MPIIRRRISAIPSVLSVICIASLAMAGVTQTCCLYVLELKSSCTTGSPMCSAPNTICSCEKADMDATVMGAGRYSTTTRDAQCYCYQSNKAANFTTTSCGTSPGIGWVRLDPPIDPANNLCCWINASAPGVSMSTWPCAATVRNCNGTPCP